MTEKVEVVIKIPKYYLTHPQDYSCLAECVRRGTPLPKGHGRLIDADELNEQEIPAIKKDGVVYVKLSTLQDLIDNAPTIVEADKVESEE